MLWRKPLIHLRNVCFEFSGCCVLINRHCDHVNEAAVQVYKWLNGIMPYRWAFDWEFEFRSEHYEQAEHDIRLLLCSTPESQGTVLHWVEHLSFIIIYHIYISSISVFLTFHFARTPLINACGYICTSNWYESVKRKRHQCFPCLHRKCAGLNGPSPSTFIMKDTERTEVSTRLRPVSTKRKYYVQM